MLVLALWMDVSERRITYSDGQFVNTGYSVDCELGHAVICSEALHRTRLNHNGYTFCRTGVGVQHLNL